MNTNLFIELDFITEGDENALALIIDVATDRGLIIIDFTENGPAGGNPNVKLMGDLLAMRKLYCWYYGCSVDHGQESFKDWFNLRQIELVNKGWLNSLKLMMSL